MENPGIRLPALSGTIPPTLPGVNTTSTSKFKLSFPMVGGAGSLQPQTTNLKKFKNATNTLINANTFKLPFMSTENGNGNGNEQDSDSTHSTVLTPPQSSTLSPTTTKTSSINNQNSTSTSCLNLSKMSMNDNDTDKGDKRVKQIH